MARKKKKWKPKAGAAPGPDGAAPVAAGPGCAACNKPIHTGELRLSCPRCARALHAGCWDVAPHCPACERVLPDRKTGRLLLDILRDFALPGSAALLLAVLVAVFYVDAYWVPFLFDDAPVITRNQLLWQWDTWWQLCRQNPNRALVNLTFLANFQLAGTPTVQGYEWRDWFSYHLVNIGFHIGNTALLYLLLRDLLATRREVPRGLGPWVALFGAALWALHPIHTMAVTYIAQRYAVMAGTVFLGALVLYVRMRRRVELDQVPAPGLRLLALVLGLAGSGLILRAILKATLLAPDLPPGVVAEGASGLPVALGILSLMGAGAVWMLVLGHTDGFPGLGFEARAFAVLLLVIATGLTKENATVAPLAILLVELLFFSGRRWWLTLPFLAIFALFVVGRGVQTQAWQHFPGDLGAWLDAMFPRSVVADHAQYFRTEIVVVLRYLHMFLLPYDLTVEQNFPILFFALEPGVGEHQVQPGLLLTAILGHALIWTFALVLLARGQRLIPLAIAWYYVAHLVESSFIPILDPMVDHRMYIPTALLPAAFCVAAARLWPALVRWRPEARLGLPALGVVLALLLGAGTFVRNLVWSSAVGIWQDTIDKRPDCARAYSSLGMEHLYLEDWIPSIGPIEAALYLGPYHVEGWNNLGKAYLELQLWDPAAAALRRGIEVDRVAPSPNVPLCWNNLGLIHIQRADLDEIEVVDLRRREPRRKDPAERRHLLEEAVRCLRQAASEARRCGFDYEVAWINLSTAEYKLMTYDAANRLGHATAAVEALVEAERISTRRGGILPSSGYYRYAVALRELGRFEEAILPTQLPQGILPGPIDRGLIGWRDSPEVQEELRLEGARIAIKAAQAGAPRAREMAAHALGWVEPLATRPDASPTALLLSGQLAHAAGDLGTAQARLEAGLALLPAQDPDAAPLRELLERIKAGKQ